ncbi:MAG: 2-hydroxy-acid oxidase [Rhodobacteraceae bacterium]|nr:2-hydroxy-acid oxidase [Paracoccaceae bacterium]
MQADAPYTGEAFERFCGGVGQVTGVALERRPSVCVQYSSGEGMPFARIPDAVVSPRSTDGVAAVMSLAAAAGVPVTCRGAGTSLEGQVVPVAGGVVLDLSQMNRIVDVSCEALDCIVEAGVTRKSLNAHLRNTGLFFPIDPGADATIGGMVSTRASGTQAVRYGTMKDNVIAVTVVLPDGRVIRTGSRARKSATGYDLTSLFVGAEGTLGVVTEVTLKLAPRPAFQLSGICQIDDLPQALAVISQALMHGLEPSRIELLDAVQTGACARYSRLDALRETNTIMFEFAGDEADVRRRAGEFAAICREEAGVSPVYFETPEIHSLYWGARERCYEAALALAPGKKNMGTDACVPLDRLAECILATKRFIGEAGLTAPLVGHVGDGNFHLGILFDPNDAEETARAEALCERVSMLAIELDGACSGEHGIGLHKRHLLERQHGDALAVMRAVKAALDPAGLMNPGKIFPG